MITKFSDLLIDFNGERLIRYYCFQKKFIYICQQQLMKIRLLPLIFVPQQSSFIVQYFGKFQKVLDPGVHFVIPLINTISQQISLKEQVHDIEAKNVVTKDNVIITLESVLYTRVVDPFKFGYGAEQPERYSQILAQSILRSEIGKLNLDQTFESRDKLNHLIVEGLQEQINEWGLECTRCEIKDIRLSEKIRKVMYLEAQAERQKRAEILAAEGQQQATINQADSEKRSKILQAQGYSDGVLIRANAMVAKIHLLSKVLKQQNGDLAARFSIAEDYIDALKNLSGKQFLLNQDVNDPKQLVRSALSLVIINIIMN
ncbi:hypothetical protein pb186bvf_006538 [Paramecium bursaria]